MEIVILGSIPLLLVLAVCVSAGRISKDEIQRDAAVRDQAKFEKEDIMAGRNGNR